MNGLCLLAIGDPSYGHWAYIFAKSVKHFHPDLPIQLVHEPRTISGIEREPFDILTEISPLHSRRGGRLSPSFAKLSMYEYYPDWEKVMFIDVDTLCIAPFLDLFDIDSDYQIQCAGTTTQESGIYPNMLWMKIENVRRIFGLPTEPIPGVNSSFQVMRLGAAAEAVYQDALRAYYHFEQHGSIKDLYMRWGNKTINPVFPDELFFNVSLATKSGYMGKNPIKFRIPRSGAFEGVQGCIDAGYRFLGFWGDKRLNDRPYQQAFELMVKRYVNPGAVMSIDRLLGGKFVTQN